MKKRTRRTTEDKIAELQAKIANIRARAERQKMKKDPALRHVAAAARSIDKAVAQTSDSATRRALEEARATLSACLSLNQVSLRPSSSVRARRIRGGEAVDRDRLLDYLSSHPGSRNEEIATALGSDTAAVRPALRSLKSEGKIRSEGQARATRYFAEV